MTRAMSIALGFFAFLLLGLPTPADAYIGPGAGLTAVGAFIALVAGVVVALIAFVWFPIRRMLRKRAKTRLDRNTSADDN
jgi:hypothetical protein